MTVTRDRRLLTFERAGQVYGVDVRDFGAVGDGTTDDTDAIQAAIDAALAFEEIPGAALGVTNLTVEVRFPAGRFPVTGLTIDGTVTATAVRDKISVLLTGAGKGATRLVSAGDGVTLITAHTCQPVIADMTLINDDTGTALSLGKSTGEAGTAISQGGARGLSIHGGLVGLRLGWAYDCRFDDLLIQGLADGGVCVQIPVNAVDCCNNLTFTRTHLEQVAGGKLLEIVGSNATPAQVHGKIVFVGGHFETRAYSTSCMDITWAQALSFLGCQILQSEMGSGTPADAVASIRLVNVTGVDFTASHISRDAVSGSYAHKLFALGGSARAVGIRNSLVSTNNGGSNQGKNALWESDATTAYTAGGPGLSVDNCIIDSASSAEVADEIRALTNAAAGNARWTERFDSALSALVWAYGANATSWTTSANDRMALDTAGVLAVSAGGLRGKKQTITNGASATFAFSSNDNANRRGLYLLTADIPSAQGWAIVASSGGALATVVAGTDFAVGTTDPGTAGKFNVYLSGTSIAVTNRFGSDRPVQVLPLGV